MTTLIYPASADIAVPSSAKWRRLPDGRLEVRYTDRYEMEVSIDVSIAIKKGKENESDT